MFRARNVVAAGVVGLVLGGLALIVVTDVTGALFAALAGIMASSEVAGFLTFCKACSGAGMGGPPAVAGSAGSAGSGGPPPGCSGGPGGTGPSKKDMADNVGTGLATDTVMEVTGETAVKSNAGKAGWGIIGIMISLLMAGPDVYCGVQSVTPLESGQQGMGKFNKGTQLDHWRAMNPDKPINEFPGYED